MIPSQPSAPFVGRLILPAREQRTQDGQVLLQLPGQDQPAPLVWETSDELKANFDLHFGPHAERARQRHDVIPERIQDWQGVKPLESLAGARPQDDLWVALKNPHWDGQRWTIREAPVEVAGPDKALVQVIGTEGKLLKVRPFDPQSQAYLAPELVETTARPERTDLARFAGQQVWLFGQQGDRFKAAALQPTDMLEMKPDQVYRGLDDSLKVLNRLWQGTADQMNESHKILLNPGGGPMRFEPGQPLMALHLFGGYRGPGGDPDRALGIVGGHFAYGRAEVDQQGRADLTYHQVYGQNPDQIVSGQSRWDAYTGSFERGWLFTRPVVDMLVDHPALQRTYRFGGKTQFNFFQSMQEELNRMEARYRVGDGDGVAAIDPITNCSQDSANALYATTRRVLELDKKVAVYPGEEQYGDFRQLVSLCRDLQKVYVDFGAPQTWEANAAREPIPPPGPVRTALQALATYKTMFPRLHQERVAAAMLKHGAQIFVQQSTTLGAPAEVEAPQSPTRLFPSH